jgi:hypothetical protein
MAQDVRDKTSLIADDVVHLNFIRHPGKYVFRRHYRQGLRSHIMEVLDPDDVVREKNGVVSDGIKWFPRAKPLKMLRIFRTRFESYPKAQEELRRVSIVASYLGPSGYARSNEFLVSYRQEDRYEILLCGLQEYIEGLNIEPWGFLNAERLADNLLRPRLGSRSTSVIEKGALITRIRRSAKAFVRHVKNMILRTGLIPDLAGDGNLILTDAGDIKLVDINNISPVSFTSDIYLDDRGYPVCDKSVEALCEIEKSLAGHPSDPSDRLYKTFFDPERMFSVSAIEKEFHRSVNRELLPGE